MCILAVPGIAAERFITLASTTSVRNSGLYDWLLPKFTAASGVDVRVIAVGTGQAIRIARRGDADALLVHDKASEVKFVADGFGIDRKAVMYNYFVLVGPKADPAAAAVSRRVPDALRAIAKTKQIFVSRGDDSGTHKMELRLWKNAGIDPAGASGSWYREVGTGMGATLNMAAAVGGYVLTDKGTWLKFANKRDLAILIPEAPALFNQYSIMLVNPRVHAHVKEKDARALIDWITGPAGQAAIADYRSDGAALFTPNAGQKPSG